MIFGVGGRAFRIQQLVSMDDEIAHQGIIDAGLRLGAPGLGRFSIVGIGADQFDLG